MGYQILTDRAKQRLQIAAGFLRRRGIQFPKDGDFYGAVLKALDEQPDKSELKSLVDWVEAYDRAISPTAQEPHEARAGQGQGRVLTDARKPNKVAKTNRRTAS